MNADHADAVSAYARGLAGMGGDGWVLTGLDVEGMDLADGDRFTRVFFDRELRSAAELRGILVDLARRARAADRPQG